jgi:cell division protein FtsI (penicillin-binding protein 3)
VLNGKLFTELPDGTSLELTIDRELQYSLEQELIAAVKVHAADGATGVVLDAQTSEILAMATVPVFNPNSPQQSENEHRRNRTVTDPIEPGSTMKTFAVAAGLENKKLEPRTQIFCENGEMAIGKRKIREADAKHKFGWLSVTEILQKSSNVGTSKISLQLGDKLLRDTLVDFGFGARTASNLPGESKGQLPELPWADHLLSNISFGHGVSATPLQIANAYAAIANGGRLMRPQIIRAVHEPDSESYEKKRIENEPVFERQVLSKADADTMKLMLSAVTADEGTGVKARVENFPVAGKTGTAQKARTDGLGYQPNSYISSFAGFLPTNDPKFVIFVAVDNPREKYYGSEVAAPLFSKVATHAMRKSNISPVILNARTDLTDNRWNRLDDLFKKNEVSSAKMASEAAGSESATSSDPLTVPELKGLSLREALTHLNGRPIKIQFVGAGVISHTFPESGVSLSKDQPLTLYLNEVQ